LKRGADIKVKGLYFDRIKDGVSLGTVIAAVISWDRNKSILLAIIHALLSWIYVIYAALFTKE